MFSDYRFVVLPTLEEAGFSDSIGVCYGKGLSLRKDFTLSLARFISSYRYVELPAKVFYFGNVFRREPQTESYQVGCELLGYRGIDAEVEVIRRLYTFLKGCGLENLTVSVGHTLIVQKLLELYPNRKTLLMYLMQKNYRALKDHPQLLELLFTQGGEEVLHEFAQKHPQLEEPLNELLELSKKLPDVNITFDLSEIRPQDYYTGVVFEIFHPDVGQPLAGGGRYDNLYPSFGLEVCAVGGAVYINTLLEV